MEKFEVIVVDNGSADRTREIAQSFSAKLNLRVLEKREGTISAVRNWGAHAARGEIFAFTDADCIVPADWLMRISSLFASPKVGIVGAHGRIPEGSSWVARAWYGDVAANKRGEVSYVPTLDLLVTRSVFFRVGGFEESIQTNEDYEFCQRVRATGFVVMGHPEIAVVHLGTPQSIVAFYQKQRWHGTHVFRVFLRNVRALGNLRAILFGLNALMGLAGTAAGAAHWVWSGSYGILSASLVVLVLPPFLLSLRISLRRRRWRDLGPLTVLHLTYGIARAVCLVEANEWWGSWRRRMGRAEPLSCDNTTPARTPDLTP